MTVAIYTACFGHFDDGQPQTPQDVDVAWYAFTDGPDFPAPWKTIRVAQDGPCARLAAKRYKTTPMVPLRERQSIWIDANTQIISPTFAREALEQLHDGIALFAQPQSDCIYAEAKASLRLAHAKYGHLPIMEQVENYRAEDAYPRHGGLFACGTIARDHDAPNMAELGRQWLHECVRWTYQDQLSFPVVCKRLGIVPGMFNERQIGATDHFGNRWQTLHAHRSER